MDAAGAIPIIGESHPEPENTEPEILHVKTAVVTYIDHQGNVVTTSDRRLLADHVISERDANPDEIYSAFAIGMSRIASQETAMAVYQLQMHAAKQMQEAALNAQIMQQAGLR